MRWNLERLKALSIASLVVALFAASCDSPAPRNNANVANSNAANSNSGSATSTTATPKDATPMGQTAPGFYTAGPAGPVSLRFTSPQDGQVISGNSIAPTFDTTGYPIYQDAERRKGQHIHVILDNEPYEADHNPNEPFIPESGKFSNLKPGLHTLRAFPAREWHESIKQPDGAAFAFITFAVGSKPASATVDKSAPLLTYSRPMGEYRWKDDPRGVLLDFYVSNATVGVNDYKVQYTLNNKKSVLTRWEPVWFKWEELGPGDHKMVLELLDKNNKPVPFKVNGVDYNRTVRNFKILNEGEQPTQPAHARNDNRNAASGAAANRNGPSNRNR